MLATYFPTTAEFDNNVTFLTNGTLDDILEDKNLLPSLGLAQAKDGFPLTFTEQNFVAEDALKFNGIDVPHDILCGSTALFNGKKCHAPVVEFHFRNDSTRHMWGTPVTLEEDLPLAAAIEDTVDTCTLRAHERLTKIGGAVHLQKVGYIDTNDRYALWLLVPFAWIVASCRDCEQYHEWLKELCV